MTEPAPAIDMRASDDERHEAAEALQEHYGSGRLTLTELDQRVASAYAAVTRDQLATLLADLPEEEPIEYSAFDPRILCLLLWVCPPAALAYWLCTRR
ncbi:MAG TPA: DUF1707 domain-containing protein [Pseudonocardiaceae bacterium]|jgi:hypothetical protein